MSQISIEELKRRDYVGKDLQRIRGHNGPRSQIGHIATVKQIQWCYRVPGESWVIFEDETSGFLGSFEILGKQYDPKQQPFDEDDI